MPTILQLRRGTTAEHSSFTGAVGEITVNTTKDTLVVHDGSTQGGFELALADLSNTSAITLSNLSGGTGISYNNSTGVIAADTDTMATKSYVDTQVQSKDALSELSGDSDDVTEGASNLYYTDARARGAVSVTDSGGDGSMSYNSSTGVITYTGPSAAEVQAHITAGTGVSISSGAVSIGQAVATSDSPTFAGLTLTGNQQITGNIVPSADVTYDLGSSTKQWKDIYVGPGSLYVNGQQVVSDNSGTITISADTNQNVAVQTSGSGDIELDPTGTGTVQIKGTLQIEDGQNITNSAGNDITFANNIKVDQITTKSTDTNLVLSGNGTGNVTVNDDINITGNLTVGGTTTTVNSETINLADNTIVLNSNFTSGTPTEDAGLSISRGGSTAKTFLWDETNDKWTIGSETFVAGTVEANLTGNVTGNVTGTVSSLSNHDTDDVAEGSTNQYFTTARAQAAISAGGDLSYSGGVVSFTERTDAEVRGLVSAGGDLSYNSTTGVMSFTERTDAEVRGLVSAGGDLSYNSTTGVMSFTQRTDAQVRGLVSASGDLSYNSSTGVMSFSETYSSAAELLTAIKTVDGAGSGLDSDLLDGQSSAYYRINIYNSAGTLLN